MNVVPYFVLLRPRQWLKNLMIFFPPVLSGSILASAHIGDGLMLLVAFCLVSSASYVLNDLVDAGRDRTHPVKRQRPVAAGVVGENNAIIMMVGLFAAGLACAVCTAPFGMLFLVAYFVVNVSYSFKLKEMPVVDLFCIASGFLIRLLAGGMIFSVTVSEWLFLSVLFLALFLSAGKRLGEQILLGSSAGTHRSSLQGYPDGTLEAFLQISAVAALLTYTMYSLAHFPLVYSVPLCTFGLFRYIVRVKGGQGGDPTEALLQDLPLLCVGVVWVLLVCWSIYG